MAWEWAGYALFAAVIVVAAAVTIGIVSVTRSLRRLDSAVAKVSEEAKLSLQQCRKLAEEAREAVAVSRRSLQGFSTLAEGARALGEAVQTVAQTAVHVTEQYRDCLISPFRSTEDHDEQSADDALDHTDLLRKLWSLWKRRFGNEPSVDCNQNPGTSADPSRGE